MHWRYQRHPVNFLCDDRFPEVRLGSLASQSPGARWGGAALGSLAARSLLGAADCARLPNALARSSSATHAAALSLSPPF